MSKRGLVTEVQVDEQGSELVADLALGATTVYVESAEDYDTAGGTVEINDVRMDYTTADLDLATLTLAAPSTVAGTIADRVSIIQGGEVAYDFGLLYSDSDTDAAYIPIPFERRAFWPEGPVDPPVPVEVSDDLTTLIDAPGRRALLNAEASEVPLFVGYLDVNQAVPTGSSYTTVTNWQVTELRGGMTYDGIFADVVVPIDGYYSVASSAVMWEINGAGRRAIRPQYGNTGFGPVTGGEMVLPADGSSRMTTALVSPVKFMAAGGRVQVQVSQTSGGSLDMIGDANGVKSFFCVQYEGPRTT